VTNNIDKTLKDRAPKYGSMLDNSVITQNLLKVIHENAKNADKLTETHWEVLHMIFLKIARMVSGDPFYVDNAHDIAGYAQLLEEYLINLNKKQS